MSPASYPLLSSISSPADLKTLPLSSCDALATEIREFIVETVTRTGGHLGSNLGAVEITLAMHRAFNSPKDVLLFDTGHQAYVHKLLTGRMADFAHLREEVGISGYPNHNESPHDVIENSHASTALSYAHGIATAFQQTHASSRRVVALVGDGALTGGMAYEALNNLGHSGSRVLVILNDNGRSYAPTISKLSESLTQLRLSPSYGAVRARVMKLLSELPAVGNLAETSMRNLSGAVRELIEPHVFFEALGIRYTGPIDGHDVGALESALKRAAKFEGPIVLHVLTQKGKGYGPAEEDEVQCLHDLKVAPKFSAPGTSSDNGAVSVPPRPPETSYTEAFSTALLRLSKENERIVAITAAMAGPTGLLSFQARYPDRFIDVGIAEQHAIGAATGMALFGLQPVVAIYSTFLGRCFDQENFDMGMHKAPVVICADRAGVTGDDGPSHHGVLDMVLGLAIPELAIFAPAEPAEIDNMLETALSLKLPALIRFPKTPGPAALAPRGEGLTHRVLTDGDDEIVIIGIGKMAAAAQGAAALLKEHHHNVTVLDPRVIRPADPDLIARAASASLVVTVEDGLVHGGAGTYLRQLIEAHASHQATQTNVNLGIPTTYIPHAKPDVILARLGLDATGIARSVLDAVDKVNGSTPTEGSGSQGGVGRLGMVAR